MTEDELAVLTADERFYKAFAAKDCRRMDALWASEHLVTCVHPGWSPLVGRGHVMASWHAIFRSDGSAAIEPTAPKVFLVGVAAYVVCFEGSVGRPPVLVATNVFAREAGAWKMVHHQAGQLSQPPEVVASGPDELES